MNELWIQLFTSTFSSSVWYSCLISPALANCTVLAVLPHGLLATPKDKTTKPQKLTNNRQRTKPQHVEIVKKLSNQNIIPINNKPGYQSIIRTKAVKQLSSIILTTLSTVTRRLHYTTNSRIMTGSLPAALLRSWKFLDYVLYIVRAEQWWLSWKTSTIAKHQTIKKPLEKYVKRVGRVGHVAFIIA